MSYLHKKLKIIHRDIKPHNLLVSADGGKSRLVVADFGVSCYFHERDKMAGAGDAEAGRSCIGTLYFAAPEIVS